MIPAEPNQLTYSQIPALPAACAALSSNEVLLSGSIRSAKTIAFAVARPCSNCQEDRPDGLHPEQLTATMGLEGDPMENLVGTFIGVRYRVLGVQPQACPCE